MAKIADVLPPAPNAASLGIYGGIDVALNSGALNKTIPLYTFTYRGMSVPISLSYHTTGFKVDDIASRVGYGWTLQAGGVITRSIIGSPDEYGIRVAQPNTVAANQETYDFLRIASAYSYSWDTQPDIFNFNFNNYTGQFAFDENANIIQIAVSNLKIEKDFSFVATWNFKITTPDGNKYYFGGPEATEKTKKTNSCGSRFVSYEPTAWYLLKIESPSGNFIDFVYGDINFAFFSGIIQSLYNNSQYNPIISCLPYGVLSSSCATIPDNICHNYLTSQGKYLKEFNTIDGGKVNFTTTTRFDCGDVLYNEIVVADFDNVSKFLYQLEYSHDNNTLFPTSLSNGIKRPFLKKLIEISPNLTIKKEHKFSYNNADELPVQLTMAQDHWGYFNGKLNSNLVAAPDELEQQRRFPDATANREPDYNYSQKGVLSKIEYPTGGWDNIYYEANKYYGQKLIYTPPVTVAANVTGTGNWVQVQSQSSFYSTHSQNIALTFQVTTSGSFDPIHNVGTVTLSTASGNVIYYSNAYSPNDGQITISNISLDPGTSYTLKVTANGAVITTTASIVYQNAPTLSVPYNIEFGGLRVAKLETFNGTSIVPSVKKFYYNQLTSPNISSAATPGLPSYFKNFKTRIGCRANSYDAIEYRYCEHSAMFSYSLTNINSFPGGASYETVVEGFGDNFEGGAIQHTYRIREDQPASLFNALGDYIGNSSMSNVSRYNGKELTQITYKKNDAGTLVPIKELEFTYKDDLRRQKSMFSYVSNEKYPIYDFPDYENQVNAFDAVTYTIGSNWEYIELIKEKNIDPMSGNVLGKTTHYFYDNPEHVQPTRIETTNSKGEVISVVNKYAGDFTGLTGSDVVTLGIKALQNKGAISSLVESSTFLNTTSGNNSRLLSSTLTFYNITNLRPSKIFQIEQSNPLIDFTAASVSAGALSYDSRYKEKSSFDIYDGDNLLQQSKASDIKISYLWGYKKIYPISQVSNAANNEIFFDSFEELGAWATPITNTAAKSHCGKLSGHIYNSNPTVEQTAHSNKWLNISLAATKRFKYSGWIFSDGPSAEIFLFMKNNSETGYFTYIDQVQTTETGKWIYVEKEVDVPSDVIKLNIRIDNNGGGNVWFDDIRLHPAAAQMTTYTYDPLVGMTSESNVNSKPTHYEYDALGRLKYIKDYKYHIIKKMDYQYQKLLNQ